MGLFGALGNGSANRPQRPPTDGPTESPGAARLAIIFDTPTASSPAAASPQVEGQVPQQTSTARPARHALAQPSAPGVLASKGSAQVTPAPLGQGTGRHRRQEEPAPVGPAQLAQPVVLAPAIPDTGRHRRTGSRRADRVAKQTSAARAPRHASTRRSAPAEPAPVGSADVTVPRAVRAVHPRSRNLALLGVLVLLLATAVVLGVRSPRVLSSAQTQPVAAATLGWSGGPVAGPSL